jgi:hypothetical protein
MRDVSEIDLVDRRPVPSRAWLLPELVPCEDFEPAPIHQFGAFGVFDLLEELNRAIFGAGRALAWLLGPIPPVDGLVAVLLLLLAFTG